MGFLWQNKAFLRLWLAQVISNLGDGMLQTALVVAVALDSRNGFMIGLVIFALLLPRALVQPFTGPLADKLPKAWLMISADVYRMGIVLAMMGLHRHLVLLILLASLHEVGSAFFSPARGSAVPIIVGESRIAQAIGISQSTSSAMAIAGPALAGVLIATGRMNLVFLSDAVTFLISALIILTLPVLLKRHETAQILQNRKYLHVLREGWVTARNSPALSFLIVLLAAFSIPLGMVNTDSNALLLNSFHVPIAQFGLMDSIAGVGGIVGALVTSNILGKLRPTSIIITALCVLGLAMIGAEGVSLLRDSIPHAWQTLPVFIWLTLFTMMATALGIPVGTLLMQHSKQELRGRIAALMQSSADFGNLFGLLAGGALAGLSGALAACIIAGILTLAITAVIPFAKGYRVLVGGPSPLGEVAESAIHDTPT